MNKRLQGFIAGILCAVLCMGVFAKTASQTIEAVYRDIKIFIDGFQIDPKDANGNTVEPFIYNGSTYLPLRAVGEALGKEVSWDGATASAYLGKVPGKQPNWMVQCPPYEISKYTSNILRSEGIKTIECGTEDMPKTHTINLNYGNQLKIEKVSKYSSCEYGLMEAYFE